MSDPVEPNGPGDFLLFNDQNDDSIPIRMFILLFLVTYAALAYTNVWRRLFLGVSLVGKFVVFCVIIDAISWLLRSLDIMNFSPFGLEMVSGLLSLAVFPHTIMRQAQLPQEGAPPLAPRTPLSAYLILAFSLTVAFVSAVVVLRLYGPAVEVLKSVAVLGGIGPGVFLAQQLLAVFTAMFGWQRIRAMKRVEYAPPIAVLVPAHNEAHAIAQTIAAVDRAAETYDGTIHMYVVDNNSSDATSATARQALANTASITGEVLFCEVPGKAVALNLGISQVKEEFIVRIDADTVIGPNCLRRAMRHFVNPHVGSVGGMPFPLEEETWIDKVRLVEVILRHGSSSWPRTVIRGFSACPECSWCTDTAPCGRSGRSLRA